MNQSMRSLIGKTVKAVEEDACNVKRLLFTDGSSLEMAAELVNGAVGLFGVETHIVPADVAVKTTAVVQ